MFEYFKILIPKKNQIDVCPIGETKTKKRPCNVSLFSWKLFMCYIPL